MDFKPAQYNTPFARYNALRSALSAYLREKNLKSGSKKLKGKKITYEGYSYNDLLSKLWQDVKQQGISSDQINADFEQIITNRLQLALFCEWWQICDVGFAQIAPDHPVIIDARITAGSEYYYKGTAEIFCSEVFPDWTNEWNNYGFDNISNDQSGVEARKLEPQTYPKWIFQFFQDKKTGVIYLYALLIDIDDFNNGLTVQQVLIKYGHMPPNLSPVAMPYATNFQIPQPPPEPDKTTQPDKPKKSKKHKAKKIKAKAKAKATKIKAKTELIKAQTELKKAETELIKAQTEKAKIDLITKLTEQYASGNLSQPAYEAAISALTN